MHINFMATFSKKYLPFNQVSLTMHFFYLDGSNPSSPPADLIEPVLPSCESVANQYNQRVMYEVCVCVDERLSTHYWQTILPPDDDIRQHMVCHYMLLFLA